MQTKFVIIVLFIISGCSPKRISIDKLQLKGNNYFYMQTNQPYTGLVISKFENGNIANIIKMKDGIPNGKWVAYGYKGEIIQEGCYQPIDISNEFFLGGRGNFVRLNVCTAKEGAFEFTDVFFVTKNFNHDYSENKNKLLAFLKSQSIYIKGDTINEVKYVMGELDAVQCHGFSTITIRKFVR
jgi:hypothetical protein